MNQYMRTITIAPITSTSKDYPTRIRFTLDGNSSLISTDQIRTIGKSRVVKIISALDQKEIRKVKALIRETFVD